MKRKEQKKRTEFHEGFCSSGGAVADELRSPAGES